MPPAALQMPANPDSDCSALMAREPAPSLAGRLAGSADETNT